MDEVLNWHRGKVDNWKQERVFAYLIALSSGNYGKNPPAIEEFAPLPYDEDKELQEDDWITTFYNNATK